MITKIDKLLYDKNLGKFFINIDGQIVEVKTGSGEGGSISIDGAITPNSTHAVSGKTVYDAIQAAVQDLEAQIEEHSVDPESVTPTVTQTTSSEQSGGDNIITFTFPNGETTQVVIKNGAQGAQGNSGYTGAVGELEVVNNLEDGGEEKALSAEMGKDLATKAIPIKGTFAEAYSKARVTNVTFPWFLSDIDTNGNNINKIIWHIGSKRFVDGIGAEIDGVRDGVTIRATGSGKIKYRGRTKPSSGDAVWCELPFTKGINNYSFAEIAEAVKTADSAVSDAYDGSTFNAIDFEFDSQNTTIDIDFGNQKFIGYGNGLQIIFNLTNRITSIKRLITNNVYLHRIIGSNNSTPETTLKYIQLSGNTTNTTFSPFTAFRTSGYFDFSGFDITGVTDLSSFLSTEDINNGPITVDIRTWDTSDITNISFFLSRRKDVTLIIGDFSMESVATTTNIFFAVTGATVVCTSNTPPDLSFDWITTYVSSIKIPNKTVTVDGNDVTVLSLYQNHVQNDGDEVGESGWSKYASIMTTYEEGEY